jgi:hypothetical protein
LRLSRVRWATHGRPTAKPPAFCRLLARGVIFGAWALYGCPAPANGQQKAFCSRSPTRHPCKMLDLRATGDCVYFVLQSRSLSAAPLTGEGFQLQKVNFWCRSICGNGS